MRLYSNHKYLTCLQHFSSEVMMISIFAFSYISYISQQVKQSHLSSLPRLTSICYRLIFDIQQLETDNHILKTQLTCLKYFVIMNIEIFIEDTAYDPIPSHPVSSHLIVWAGSPLYVQTYYIVIPKGGSNIFEFHMSTSV